MGFLTLSATILTIVYNQASQLVKRWDLFKCRVFVEEVTVNNSEVDTVDLD